MQSNTSRNRIVNVCNVLRNFAALGVLAVTLVACGTNPKGSVMGGDCKAFERPVYQVKGKAQYDQDWIDGNIEAGVGACNWERPAARPPSLDVPVATRRPPVIAPPKKKTILERLHLKRKPKPGVVTSQLPRGRPFDLGDDLGETIIPSANAAPVEEVPPAVITAPPAAREDDVFDDAATTEAILGKRAPPQKSCAWYQRSC